MFLTKTNKENKKEETMHTIEPFFRWRNLYMAEQDEHSPFYGRSYSEFQFSQKVYNYYIHPQWDAFGSPTLYIKILFVDYEKRYAILEFIGEWNDCIENDIMFLKQEVIDQLMEQGIHKFILCTDHVMNFHASDDCYYEAWNEYLDDGGWICILNTRDHVLQEMESANIQLYCMIGSNFNAVNWQNKKPEQVLLDVESRIHSGIKQLYY